MSRPPSRPLARRAARLALALLIVAGLAPPALSSLAPASRAAAQSPGGCIEGRNLVRNGSFEAPGIETGSDVASPYFPVDWYGDMTGITRGLALTSGYPVSGNVVLRYAGSATQYIDTSALANARLRLRYTSVGGAPGVPPARASFNGQPLSPFPGPGLNDFTVRIDIGATPPAFSTLSFSGGILDNIILDIVYCGLNFPPLASGLDGPYTTPPSVPVSDTFAVSDTETPAANLAVTTTQGDHGTVTVTGTGASRRLTYLPDPGFAGTDAFTLTVSDGQASRDYALSVTVVAPPPTLTITGGPQDGATYARNAVPAAPICTARDGRGATIPCTVSGYSTQPGTRTLTFRAVDDAGLETTRTRTYTVTTAVAPPTPRPTRPVRTATATATPPVATPTTPVVTPTSPVVTPTTPAVTPTTPVVTPTTPASGPSTRPTRPPRG